MMLKFLKSYLIKTGSTAAVALAFPDVVTMGFFLLLLPGFLLMLSPTAFLWGCVFTLSWLFARALLGENWRTWAASVLLTAGTLFAATLPNRTAGTAAYQASLFPDVAPPDPISVQGDIRIDLPRPNWDNSNARPKSEPRGFACGNLCLGLLFTPGVDSVTINDSNHLTEQDHRRGGGGFHLEARTYRLLPKAQCADGGLLPDLSSQSGLFPVQPGEDHAALEAEWNLRLANEVCLVRTGPIGRHDLLIRHGSYGEPRQRQSWRLQPSRPWIEYVEIRGGGGEVFLRRFKSEVQVLSSLLHIWGNFAGGGSLAFEFGWGTSTISNKLADDQIELLPALERHTRIVGRASGADLLPRLRRQFAASLDDPNLTGEAPAFQLLAPYFEALPSPLLPEDLAIVTRLARDERIRSYNGITMLDALPEPQQRAIRDALAERALTTSDMGRMAETGASSFFRALPDGSFKRLTAEEEQLLRSTERRWSLPDLAARLHESGAGRVPLLVDIVRDHGDALARIVADVRAQRIRNYDKSNEIDGHRAMMTAARTALCRLGPAASLAIGPIRRMGGDGTISKHQLSGHDGSDWHFMLARIGMPVEQLTKPANLSGTDEQHRDRIRDKLRLNDPERHC